MERNEHIVDLVASVEARLTSLCPLVKAVTRSQATSFKDIAELIPRLEVLPAAVVVLGPVQGDDEISAKASRYRVVNLGVLIVGEYSAEGDAGAAEFWTVLDQVHDAMIPSKERSENEAFPVAVLGDQSGANRGTLLIPGGYRIVGATQGRCAGVYNLLALDTVRERA